MDIDGPIRVSVVEPSPEGNYELHIRFTEEFQHQDLAQQGPAFRDYLGRLYQDVRRPDLDDRTRQGMLLIQQVCEQLLEPIEAGDLPLSETLVVEIQRTPGIDLSDLLN
ncbi:MAG: transcriptional regulator [Gammaproteobacteria bacterium]|nr:MAG: transcriptional regulator [Gammaproteobacteria bacterium]